MPCDIDMSLERASSRAGAEPGPPQQVLEVQLGSCHALALREPDSTAVGDRDFVIAPTRVRANAAQGRRASMLARDRRRT